MKRCKTCKQPIEEINYALGPQWMHIIPEAGWHSERSGTAWRHCKLTVAEPEDA